MTTRERPGSIGVAQSISRDRDTDVLIIGGGFAGMNAALKFDRMLGRRFDANVTLISRTNFYLFTPLLAEVAASLIQARHAVNPVRRMLRRVRFIQGTVRRLNPEACEISFVDENGEERRLTYGHCILAPGSTTEFFGVDGMAECAFTLKTLGDAIRIRNHVVRLLERADLLLPEQQRHLLTLAVVGGGLNGIEVAGELNDFVVHAVEDYSNICADDIRMVLIEMRDSLAQELPPQLGAYSKRNLESRGLELWLGARVIRYEDGVLQTHDGRELATETVIWTAGVRPSPLIEHVPTERLSGDDRLPTNEFLQVRGHETLWAVGDCALIPDKEREGYHPPTAQHAVRQGKHAARNIAAALQGRPLSPFQYRGLGMLATLGRYRGAGRVFGVRLTGFIAWFAWRTYYLVALPRWERRLRVAFDWTLDLLFPPDIVELKVEPSLPEQEIGLSKPNVDVQRLDGPTEPAA
jgi:NADH dehydrogenase